MNDGIVDYTDLFRGRNPTKAEEDAIQLIMPHIRTMSKGVEIQITSSPNGKNTLYEEFKNQKFFADWQKTIESSNKVDEQSTL